MKRTMLLLWMAGLLAVPGCAARQAPAPAPADAPAGATLLVVENNLTEFSDVTVYVEPQSGVRQSLGSVRSGSTATLVYQGTGVLQFVAQPVTGSPITSERVSALSPSRIRWVLNTNKISLRSR